MAKWTCEKHGEYEGDFCTLCAREAVADDDWWNGNLPEIRAAALESLRSECARLKAALEESERLLADKSIALIRQDECHRKAVDTASDYIEKAGLLRSELTCAKEQVRAADRRSDELEKERDAALAERDEERKIVDRVWKALGISTFLGAKGLAIDEHVSRLLSSQKSAEEEVGRLRGLLEHAVTYIAPAKDFGPMMEGPCSVCNAMISKFECEAVFLCSECLTRQIDSALGSPR